MNSDCNRYVLEKLSNPEKCPFVGNFQNLARKHFQSQFSKLIQNWKKLATGCGRQNLSKLGADGNSSK
jgi:hypothetical protein